MKLKRITWIDTSKGIGIILVVYGHVARGMEAAGLIFLGFAGIDKLVYSFHMPLFFALSGYFFIKSQGNVSHYLKSKISTILYPYLLWSLIQLQIQIITSNLINGEVSWGDLITFYMPRAQFWFLFALFTINLVNLFLYRIFKLNGIILSTILSIICLASNVNLGVLNFGFYNIVYFNIGIFLSILPNAEDAILNSRYFLLTVLFVFILLEGFTIYFLPDSMAIHILCGIVGTIFIFQLSNQFLSNANHLITLGKNSMPIYLIHTIFSGGIRIVLQKFFLIENIFLHILLGTLGGIYLSLFIYQYLLAERFPSLFTLNRFLKSK